MPTSNKPPHRYIGLMSGTSLDGIDGVLAQFDTTAAGAVTAHTLAFASAPFSASLRDQLLALQQPQFNDLEIGAQAGLAVARAYAAVIAELLRGEPASTVRAVGAHGQTVRHRPQLGYTLQLIAGSHLAEHCGIDVICDFRAADMAAGGQGAPLVPAFHRSVFGGTRARRAIVNIGGIANVSLLAPGAPVQGFDTGPGNTLLDAWVSRHRGLSFDAHGAWGQSGQVQPGLLQTLLAEPYFQRTAPKSTHRDHFDLAWLDSALAKSQAPGAACKAEDVQATLCALTAATIAAAIREFGATEAFVCGGGAKNSDLMNRLAKAIAPAKLASTQQLGLDPQSIEALAFAWLAHQRVNDRPGNESAATGAAGPRVLGAWYRHSG